MTAQTSLARDGPLLAQAAWPTPRRGTSLHSRANDILVRREPRPEMTVAALQVLGIYLGTPWVVAGRVVVCLL